MADAGLLRREQVFFDDISEGTGIPPLTKGPYNVMMMAKFASMYGDFYPGHYDNKWAVEMDRVPTALAHGFQVQTFLSQMLTDWISPSGRLRKFASQVRSQTYVGDILTFEGKVTKKYLMEGRGFVDCEVWGEKQDGKLVIQGAATVILPLRRGTGISLQGG